MMQIVETLKFQRQRELIVTYIAQDKKSAAISFLQRMKKKVNGLKNFPYKYRASLYYDDEEIRDMVFEKYTIVYQIQNQQNKIIILEIFNKNKPPQI